MGRGSLGRRVAGSKSLGWRVVGRVTGEEGGGRESLDTCMRGFTSRKSLLPILACR